jgi:hypothetical protein
MRIAISGTYSTGKTTTALALSYITGYALTTASTMRELLPQMIPGKSLEECNPSEILQLVLTRIIERSNSESGYSFISDGCPFQELSYSIARLKYGFNPNLSRTRFFYKRITNYRSYKVFESIIRNIEDALVRYVESTYDYIVHLPLELPLANDGHRPVNEEFRKYADDIQQELYKKTKIPIIKVSGSIKNRIEVLCLTLNIETKSDMEKIIEKAKSDCFKKYNSIALENKIIK